MRFNEPSGFFAGLATKPYDEVNKMYYYEKFHKQKGVF